MTVKKNRAFLKWAGGKYGLVDKITQRLPAADKLIEPFVGAGSVFLNTHYKRYLLNDINPDLISLYEQLRDKPDQFIDDARQLFTALHNHENQYYGLREEFNSTRDPWLRAVLFVYLNRHGYNGLCRYSAKGRFNVPFGRYKKPYFPEQEMWYFAEKARFATFSCVSFEHVFKRVRKGHVVYCDPPYIPISASASFTAYARNGFDFEAQKALAELASETARKKSVTVLLSNHDLPVTRELYQGASITSLDVARSISQKGHKRKPVKEVLALFHPEK